MIRVCTLSVYYSSQLRNSDSIFVSHPIINQGHIV